MDTDALNFAWHRSLGKLINQLDAPVFWNSLVRLLKAYVKVDTWVVLVFSAQDVQFVCCRETISEAGKDALLLNYLKGLYVLDPFYIANLGNPQTGFFHLGDIAPTHFHETEYFNTYFKHYVTADEVQFNVQLDKGKTLCLSLGRRSKFSQQQIALLDLVHPWVIALMRQRMNFEFNLENHILGTYQWQNTMAQLAGLLTSRELEIAKLMFSGFSNAQISEKMSISEGTVKSHRRNIYAKLSIKSQSEFFALFFHEKK